MALETGTYISDLVSTNPVSSDNISQGDDHIRLLKSTIKATFPNAAGPIGLSSAAASGAAILSVTDNTNAALRITQLGTGPAIRVEDEANPDSTSFIVDASGNVGIGTTAPATKLEVAGTTPSIRLNSGGTPASLYGLEITNGTTVDGYIRSRGGTGETQIGSGRSAGWGGHITFYTDTSERMRIDASGNVIIGGTVATDSSKLTVAGGISNIGTQFNARPGSGVNYEIVNRIGAGFDFYVNNATALAARIDSSGNVLVTSSGGLGYGTGSGGTVTQATNKTTAVTLNKTNGKITLSNATLTAGQSVTFDVNNSTVAATDTVIISMAYTGSGAGNYNYHVGELGAGYFTVCIKNVSAISLSDAVIFNFSVIKATTS